MSNDKATKRFYGGNYTKFTWSLIFFLAVNIVLDVVFLLQDFGFLRGVLVWNVVVVGQHRFPISFSYSEPGAFSFSEVVGPCDPRKSKDTPSFVKLDSVRATIIDLVC